MEVGDSPEDNYSRSCEVTGPAVQLRQQRVLELIREAKKGLTIKEIADTLNSQYHTVRNYVLALEKAGLVEMTAETRDRASVYAMPNLSTIPTVGNSNLWAILDNQASTDIAFKPGLVWRKFLRISLDFFNAAYMANSEGPNPSRQHLLDIRARLMENREQLMILLKAHDAMINNPNLVDPGRIGKVLMGDKTIPVTAEAFVDVNTNLGTALHKAGNRL